MNFQSALSSIKINNETGQVILSDTWGQGKSIFGGLQVALLLDYLEKATNISLENLKGIQVIFLDLVEPKEATLNCIPLRQGNTKFFELILKQGSKICCKVIATVGAERSSSVAVDNLSYPDELPSLDQLQDIPFLPGITPNCTQHFQMRIAQGDFPFTGSSKDSTSVYIKLREDIKPCIKTISAIADATPSPALSKLKKPAFASSVKWNLHFLNKGTLRDIQRWVLLKSKILHADKGSISEQCTLWCVNSKKPIAISQQLISLYDG